VLVAVFMVNSLALAYMGTKKAAAPKTIFDTAAETAPPASGPLGVTVPGAGANPGAAPIPAPAAPAVPAAAGSAPAKP
jgi:hypothetical protein